MNTKHFDSLEALLAEESWLRALSRQLLRDPHAAADLAQETWLAALKAPPTQTGSARGWLRTVAERLVQRKHFKSLARTEREEQASRGERVPATVDGVAHAENIKVLVEATLRLEEPFRETVLLRYFENKSPRQIAQEMGVPAATVRSRLTRAHGKLRADLAGEIEEADLRGAGWLASFSDWCIDRSNGWMFTRAPLAVVGAFVAVAIALFVQLGRGSVQEEGRSLEQAVVAQEQSSSARVRLPAGSALPMQADPVRRASLASALQPAGTGLILAQDGSPIADALLVVRASRTGRAELAVVDGNPESKSEGPPTEIELRSNAQGEFEVPSEYMTEIASRWGEAKFYVSHESDKFWKVSQALESGVPIELRPLWRVALRGEVRDAGTDQVLEGVQVFYGPDGIETETDGEGQFRFEGLPSYQGRTTRLYHQEYAMGEVSTPLVGPEPALQVFRLERGVGLLLSFEDEESGAALEGVEVFYDEEGEASVRSDSSGRAGLRLPASGAQVLRGECEGYANFEWSIPSGAIEEAQTVRVPLARLSHVDGVLQDTGGHGLEGVRVYSSPREEPVALHFPDLPGTLRWTLRSVRGWEPALHLHRSDSNGRFHVAVLESQGPWEMLASVHKIGKAEASVDSLGEDLTLVLKPSAASNGISVSGTLLRGGKPWIEEAHLVLDGPTTAWASGGEDGVFELRVFEPGNYRLSWAGQHLMDVIAGEGEPQVDLGPVNLDRLPLLDLRLETAGGAALAKKVVWIYALDPPALAIVGPEGYRRSRIRGKTDGRGNLRTLLPCDGEYRVALLDEEIIHEQIVNVRGDTEELIRVPDAEHVFLRLRHAESRELLGELAYEQWMVSCRVGPSSEVRMTTGHTRFDGLFEILLPRAAQAIILRPIMSGYQTRVLSRAQFAGTSAEEPLDVLLQPGVPVSLEFDEWPRDELGDDLELFLVAQVELGLVREILPSEQLAALAARGRSWRFVDPLLAVMQLGKAQGQLSLDVDGLTPGSYTIVAFDRTRRRSDVQFDPSEFEIGPGSASVQLHLRE